MGFGRKMEHSVRLMRSEDAVERRRIADVGLLELIAGMSGKCSHRLRRSRIGKLIEIDDLHLGFGDEQGGTEPTR